MHEYCERIHGQDLNCQKQMNQHEMVDFIGKGDVIQCCVALPFARFRIQFRYLCGREESSIVIGKKNGFARDKYNGKWVPNDCRSH